MRIVRANKGSGLRRTCLFALLVLAMAALFTGSASSASAAGKWKIVSVSNPGVAPGGEMKYFVTILNVGDQPLPAAPGGDPENCTPGAPAPPSVPDNCYEVRASFPAGMTALGGTELPGGTACTVDGGTNSVTCQATGELPGIAAGKKFQLTFTVSVDPAASGTLTPSFEVSGAGGGTVGTVDATSASSDPLAFGIGDFDVQASADAAGTPLTQAAGHPYDFSTSLEFNSFDTPSFFLGALRPVEATKDIVADLPPGLIGSPASVDQCTTEQLANGEGIEDHPLCPVTSQVGVVYLHLAFPGSSAFLGPAALYNMVPPPGAAARFSFNVAGSIVTLDAKLRNDSDYGVSVIGRNFPQGLDVQGSILTLWGAPSSAAHDSERACPGDIAVAGGGKTCTNGAPPRAFLRLPTSCTASGQGAPDPGLPYSVAADSWEHPGALGSNGRADLSDPAWDSRAIASHELPGYPAAPQDWGNKRGTEGCDKVPVKGELSAKPTSLDTETSTGLDVHVEVPNPGMENPEGIAASDIEGVNLALPQGVTINASQAEGLGVCSPAQYESSRLEFNPDGNHGCPSNSKIGSVSVKTQLLRETLSGNVYIAKPYENPFNSLLALYIVIAEPQRGILVKLPGEVRTDETTGRIESEFKDLPQVPFETFDFHFREGARAPLATPSTCGKYTSKATFTPWSDQSHKITSISNFEIVHGIGGGPCPSAGTPDFKPGFSAGSINNNAGSYSPFNMRVTRKDGEQEMTRFSAVLPPGVLGKLAGVSKCPDSAIAIAKAKTGPHGGQEEIDHPSCPANSEIGHSIVGAGVGSVLTYVPGKVYLGGPFNGRPLSVIAITPVVAGPFDVGTVVVHEALTLNPKTAEVEVDGSASDPIPHILKGIPAKLRDLRVYVDRPEFTLNPTSCDPSSAKATLFGGGGNAFSTADDVPVLLSDRYQAASCASLGFKPKLALKLKGGTKRGGHPGLTAIYTPKKGDANVKALTVRLPRSAFLDQAHIRTICTRVQFAADSCPKGAKYGFIKAWSPLIEDPLEGPVWLRSSNHKLPDLVFDLHGLVDIEVGVRIDSEKGGIRASLESSPDAPLSKVLLKMQGAKKGLIINSRNLCGAPSKANVDFVGHNGKEASANPVMQAECGGKGRKKKR
jgi:hypothetical protein